LQNTATNLGASIGTALAGAVLISILTSSFLTEVAQNPDVPDDVVVQAEAELAGGIPFVSDADLEAAFDDAGVPADTAASVIDDYSLARIDGLRAALAALAILALLGLLAARRIPTEPVAASGLPAEV